MRDMHRRLRRIHKGLVFQYGPNGTEWDLEISADGVVELIPIVQRVVAESPKIEGWTIHAFRQRSNDIGTVESPGGRIGIDTVRFDCDRSGQKIGIRVYVTGLTRQNEPRIAGLIYLLMDGLVGEYDAITKIVAFDIQPMPPNPTNLAPLHELRELVDSLDAN